MKLVDILARELTEWPCSDDALIYSTESGMIWDSDEETHGQIFYEGEFVYESVTRADWEAARALLASDQAQPLGDSEEFDQALWDQVALVRFGKIKDEVDAFDAADAFMAERAKRIAARKANHD